MQEANCSWFYTPSFWLSLCVCTLHFPCSLLSKLTFYTNIYFGGLKLFFYCSITSSCDSFLLRCFWNGEICSPDDNNQTCIRHASKSTRQLDFDSKNQRWGQIGVTWNINPLYGQVIAGCFISWIPTSWSNKIPMQYTVWWKKITTAHFSQEKKCWVYWWLELSYLVKY